MSEFAEVDAVVLVGGQGSRLRPLTLSAAKPMLPTAGVPFLAHLLSRLRAVGIRRVVLGTSYRAETFSEYFGDGSDFGLTLTYVVEKSPLGTGGAIRNVLDQLEAPTVMVFNGDILSGVDLSALLSTHRKQEADVTLHLVRVPDARAFGCVPTDEHGRVLSFVEKSEFPETNQINAGCYVFQREVIASVPAGVVVSVEHDTFPGLLTRRARLFGHVDTTYWLDLGTPSAFIQGSVDLVRGAAPTDALPGPIGDALLLPGAVVEGGARVGGGTTLGRDVVVSVGADVDGSVVFDGAMIGAGAQIERSVIGHGVIIGQHARIADTVIGDHARIGDGAELTGSRVWPQQHIGAGTKNSVLI